jgi:hypothetical protein
VAESLGVDGLRVCWRARIGQRGIHVVLWQPGTNAANYDHHDVHIYDVDYDDD